MSTSASVEKKTKKTAKKASKKEVVMEKIEEPEPVVAAPEPIVNEMSIETPIDDSTEYNTEFYSLMEKIIGYFNDLTEISKKLDIIDEKQIKSFIVEKKKMDKAINTFEITYLESLAGAYKIAKKASSKKSAKKIVDPANPGSEPAVKKPLECENCLHSFMGKSDTSELISRNQAYTSVTDFVKSEKKSNPEKISANLDNDKEFRVYGKLKKFLDEVGKIINKNISLIQSEIKVYESSKFEEGSKQFKELSNLRDELERLNKLKSIPEVMGYTNVMSYTNLCFTSDYLNKIKAKPVKSKVSKK